MGWEIVPYTDAKSVRDHAPDEIVVGHMASVRAGLRALGLPVVEVNDGYALGAYGLLPLAYARFLSARWAQMSGTEDYCDF